ncbi:hypothetical protein D3C86_2052540 [compost metagenome]
MSIASLILLILTVWRASTRALMSAATLEVFSLTLMARSFSREAFRVSILAVVIRSRSTRLMISLIALIADA